MRQLPAVDAAGMAPRRVYENPYSDPSSVKPDSDAAVSGQLKQFLDEWYLTKQIMEAHLDLCRYCII